MFYVDQNSGNGRFVVEKRLGIKEWNGSEYVDLNSFKETTYDMTNSYLALTIDKVATTYTFTF